MCVFHFVVTIASTDGIIFFYVVVHVYSVIRAAKCLVLFMVQLSWEVKFTVLTHKFNFCTKVSTINTKNT